MRFSSQAIIVTAIIIAHTAHAMESCITERAPVLKRSFSDESNVPRKKSKVPVDILQKAQCFLQKNPLIQHVLEAYENDDHPFSKTIVYVYNELNDSFEKQGDLTSLTPEQLQACIQNKYYYKPYMGHYRTRFSTTPEAIGALVFGNELSLEQKFEIAYTQQTRYAQEHLSLTQGIRHCCDVHGWDTLMVTSE